MRSRLLMLFVVAAFAGLIAHSARAVEQPASTTGTRQPTVMEKLNANVCDIGGTVLRVVRVDKSPWGLEAPSQMNTVETHVSVSIDVRTPHRKDAAEDHPCLKTTKGTLRTYKLCSPIRVKQGDRIQATEGLNTGNARAIGCLFDIKVVEAAPPAAKKI